MGLTAHCMMMKGSSKVHRLSVKRQVVQAAQAFGIKPVSRRFGIARNTVRTWVRQFEAGGNKGLRDKRAGPNSIPHKTPKEIEDKVVQARKEAPCYGPVRLKYFFELECSLGAIQRILKAHKLTRKRKKKYQTKQDLRAVKAAKYQSLAHLQMDVKHLYDIPNYWGQRKLCNLPKYQYTVRDTKSGMLFLGFSDELSELNARTMIDHILKKIKQENPSLRVTVQTDNGVEFSGTARHFERSPFSQLIHAHGAQHVYIPPGMCNANGDVESSHHLIEIEFFDLTQFNSRDDFFRKVESYRLFFNIARPNYSKQAKTPWQIAQEDWPETDFSSEALSIATFDLDKVNTIFNKKDYNLGGQSFPDSTVLISFVMLTL